MQNVEEINSYLAAATSVCKFAEDGHLLIVADSRLLISIWGLWASWGLRREKVPRPLHFILTKAKDRYIFFEDVSSKFSALTWIQEVVAIVGSQVRNRSYFCFYLRVFFNRWTVWSILCLYFNILWLSSDLDLKRSRRPQRVMFACLKHQADHTECGGWVE